jgi:hypothetical protein
MGIAEIDLQKKWMEIHSSIIIYGQYASEELAAEMREEIEEMWNEPKGFVHLGGERFDVRFRIKAYWEPKLRPEDIHSNINPKNNYFRIEEYAHARISFVDDLGSNTGYFLISNLYKGSTTAAHEYGHTLGLEHPTDLNYRGKGAPGIMYPRGTLVDAPYQYNPAAAYGEDGHTMHPIHRRVRQQDIDDLQLHRLRIENNQAIVGAFTSIWHEAEYPEN